MNADDVRSFTEHGYVRCRGLHPADRIASLRQALRAELKRLQAAKGYAALRGLPPFQQIGKLSALAKVPQLHETLVTSEVRNALVQLTGHSPPPGLGTQLLLSPPRQGAWTLQGLNWHVDVSTQPKDPLPGVQAFYLIDDVLPQGGATLALAGSHRAGVRQAVREVLRTADDLERGLRELGIGVVELCGRAGDVFFMDMRLLHTPSINATKNFRIMATTRCVFR